LTDMEEKVLRKAIGVMMFEGEKPSFGLRYRRGTLILTNLRLVYVPKSIPGSMLTSTTLGRALGELASRDKIYDLLEDPERLEVALNPSTRAKSGRHLGTAYLTIWHKENHEETAHCFTFGEGLVGKADWAEAINSAKASLRTVPVPARVRYCVECGSEMRAGAKFCVVCGHETRSTGEPT